MDEKTQEAVRILAEELPRVRALLEQLMSAPMSTQRAALGEQQAMRRMAQRPEKYGR